MYFPGLSQCVTWPTDLLCWGLSRISELSHTGQTCRAVVFNWFQRSDALSVRLDHRKEHVCTIENYAATILLSLKDTIRRICISIKATDPPPSKKNGLLS